MAQEKRREFMVGVAALVAIILVIYLTVQIRGLPLLEGTYEVDVRFGEVSGSLTQGANVVVYGVRVGEVTGIEIDPDPLFPDRPVTVTLRIRKSVTLYENAEVEVAESAIIGETTLIVTPGTPGQPEISDGEVIHGTDPVSILGDLQRAAPEILLQIGESVRIVNDFLNQLNEEGELEEAISDLAAIINAVEESISSGEGNINAMIQDIRAFTAHLNQSIALFDETILQVREDVRSLRLEISAAVDSVGSDANRALTRMDAALAELDTSARLMSEYMETNADDWQAITERTARITRRVDELLASAASGEGTLGRLMTDDELHREVVTLLGLLNMWLSQIDTIVDGVKEPIEERTVPYLEGLEEPSP